MGEHATGNHEPKKGTTSLQQPPGTTRIFKGELATQERRDLCKGKKGITDLERKEKGKSKLEEQARKENANLSKAI